eukprot:5317988-Prymnesium_polylepis.1
MLREPRLGRKPPRPAGPRVPAKKPNVEPAANALAQEETRCGRLASLRTCTRARRPSPTLRRTARGGGACASAARRSPPPPRARSTPRRSAAAAGRSVRLSATHRTWRAASWGRASVSARRSACTTRS